jgi:hypothetical protein
LGGEKLSHPEADRADLVRRVSGANGAAARVIKKTQQTPEEELDLAVKRQKEVESGKTAK